MKLAAIYLYGIGCLLGELGGLLEATDGGTTSIVDHVHMAYSPGHGLAGSTATLISGIRSRSRLRLRPRFERWDNEAVANTELLLDWFFPLLRNLNDQCQTSRGKLAIGLGFDSYTLPLEDVLAIADSEPR